MMRLPRLGLARDSRGTSAIEFALFAPFLAALVMGIADTSRALARKFEIEQASYRALELITVGSIQSDYAYVKPEAAAAAGEPEANVTVENWLECEGVRNADFGATCATGEQTARFVKVSIISDFEPTFTYGPLGTNFVNVRADGTVRLTARSTLRVQ